MPFLFPELYGLTSIPFTLVRSLLHSLKLKRVKHISLITINLFELIKDALIDNSPRSVEARVNVAQNNTWDQRVLEIYRVIEKHLEGQTALKQPEYNQHEMVP